MHAIIVYLLLLPAVSLGQDIGQQFSYAFALAHAYLLACLSSHAATVSCAMSWIQHICAVAAGTQAPQQLNATTNFTNPNPTPKPHEITTSVTTPQHYENTGSYSTLSQELQEFTHSRINAELKPGHDIMQIMLELLQWNEQDVEQMWVRPADHVDQAKYDDSTPDGLQSSLQDLLRKV